MMRMGSRVNRLFIDVKIGLVKLKFVMRIILFEGL